MRNFKITIIVMVIFSVNFVFIPDTLAQESEEFSKAIGLGASAIGGSGLTYRTFIADDTALQFSGAINGNKDEFLRYNFGLMYQKVLHQGKYTRLFLAPGFSWRQRIDFDESDDVYVVYDYDGNKRYYFDRKYSRMFITGVDVGAELQLNQLALGLFFGYGVGSIWSYGSNTYRLDGYVREYSDSYDSREDALAQELKVKSYFGPTAGIFLLYYF